MANLTKLETENNLLYTPEDGYVSYCFGQDESGNVVIFAKKSNGEVVVVSGSGGGGGGSGGSSADKLPVMDAGNYFTSDNVEGVLQEIGETLDGLEAELAEI